MRTLRPTYQLFLVSVGITVTSGVCTAAPSEKGIPPELLIVAEQTKSAYDEIRSFKLKRIYKAFSPNAPLPVPDQKTGARTDRIESEMVMSGSKMLVSRTWTIEAKELDKPQVLFEAGLVNDRGYYQYVGGYPKETRQLFEHSNIESMAADLVNLMKLMWDPDPRIHGFTDGLGRFMLDTIRENETNSSVVWTLSENNSIYRCIAHWEGNANDSSTSCTIYDVDAKRGFLVIRCEIRDKNGHLILEQNVEPQQIGETWFPKTVKHRLNDLHVELEFSDVEINPDLPDSFFTFENIELKEGDIMVRYSPDRTVKTEMTFTNSTWIPRDLIKE